MIHYYYITTLQQVVQSITYKRKLSANNVCFKRNAHLKLTYSESITASSVKKNKISNWQLFSKNKRLPLTKIILKDALRVLVGNLIYCYRSSQCELAYAWYNSKALVKNLSKIRKSMEVFFIKGLR